LSSRGTLLLTLTGAGLVVFLLFLLPSLNASRAATPRGSRPEPRAEGPAPARTTELVQPIAVESEEDPVAEERAEPGTAMAATAVPATALAVAEGRPKVEGPPMRIHRESGTKSDTVDHRELRQTNRERRKERREGTAANERAFGKEGGRAVDEEKYRTRTDPDRGRLGQRGGKGSKQGQGKGKPKGG
jgi:hypothetical protein